MRYWLSAGRGGFGLSSAECYGPAFYVVVYTTPEPPHQAHLNGGKVGPTPPPYNTQGRGHVLPAEVRTVVCKAAYMNALRA